MQAHAESSYTVAAPPIVESIHKPDSRCYNLIELKNTQTKSTPYPLASRRQRTNPTQAETA